MEQQVLRALNKSLSNHVQNGSSSESVKVANDGSPATLHDAQFLNLRASLSSHPRRWRGRLGCCLRWWLFAGASIALGSELGSDRWLWSLRGD